MTSRSETGGPEADINKPRVRVVSAGEAVSEIGLILIVGTVLSAGVFIWKLRTASRILGLG